MGKKIVVLLIKIRNALFGSPPDVNAITNPHQAKEAHRTVPSFYRRKIVNMWDNFTFAEIKTEQTLNQITKTYLDARLDSKAEKATFKKGNTLLLKLISNAPCATTLREINEEGYAFLNKEVKETISKKTKELQKN